MNEPRLASAMAGVADEPQLAKDFQRALGAAKNVSATDEIWR